RAVTKIAIRLGVFDPERILHEIGAKWLNFFAQRDGIRQINTGVDIHADLDVITNRFSYCLEFLDRAAHRRTGFENSSFLMGQTPAYDFPACFNGSLAGLHQFLYCLANIVIISDNFIPCETTQKLIDRNAQCFTFDIPKRDVDGSDGGGENPLCWKKTAAKQHLPDILGAEWVLPNKKRFE